jgi:hypothetical protein
MGRPETLRRKVLQTIHQLAAVLHNYPDAASDGTLLWCAGVVKMKDFAVVAQFEPKGDHTKFVAKAIKKFLAETIEVQIVDNPFRRQVNGKGEIISLCEQCCELVLISADEGEVEIAESAHQCVIGDIAASSE